MNYGFFDAQRVLGLVSHLLSRGLTHEKRRAAFDGIPTLAEASATAEMDLYKLLLAEYERDPTLSFATPIIRYLLATRMWFRAMPADLDQLRATSTELGLLPTEEAKKPFVFAILPFDHKHKMVYQRVVRPTLEARGCEVERADDVFEQGEIIKQIYTRIERAAFLVADTSGRNPNVFYEVGYAHALGKAVILMAQSVSEIPFDIAQHRHIIYDPNSPDLHEEALGHTIDAVLKDNPGPKR